MGPQKLFLGLSSRTRQASSLPPSGTVQTPSSCRSHTQQLQQQHILVKMYMQIQNSATNSVALC